MTLKQETENVTFKQETENVILRQKDKECDAERRRQPKTTNHR